MSDITKEGLTSFDAYMDAISSRPRTFAVALDGRPTLIFRRTLDWDECQAIRQKAINQTRAAAEGNVHPTWKEFIGSDPSVVGRAVHLASRHVGVLVEGELVEEKWHELQFMKVAKMDPHGFTALMDAMNNEVGVGWSVEDRDYFRKEDRKPQEEPDGSA